jgi:RNA recognition motif-containing protein
LLPSQSTIFVDNLPIDVTVDEVTELYSRCGDIVSVELFNLRQDLDPGSLGKAGIASRRKALLRSVSARHRKWERPKTPVYGLVVFADPEGYRVATDISLCVFGMLVRRHPVRSIRSVEMNSLCIENIPGDHPCIDFEFQLSQKLHPDLFVCLDATQNKNVMVGSCDIKFPSFEVALESYDKLKDLDILQRHPECTLNWIHTPKDADLWWTRKRGFD